VEQATCLFRSLDLATGTGYNVDGGLAMNVDQTISDLSTLPIDDCLRVVHAIWDTLPDDVDLKPTPEQQAELDRRLAAHRADPATAISHEELIRRIESRR